MALQAARHAGLPVRVLPRDTMERWTDGEVTEDRVRSRWAAGNDLFGPVFLASSTAGDGFRPSASDRCYYFPSRDVEQHRVGGAVARFCFRGSDRIAHASGYVTVLR